LNTLQFTRDQLKEKYSDIFDKSRHLFDGVIANKLDSHILNVMFSNLKERSKSKDQEEKTDLKMGKFLFQKYGKGIETPKLSEQQEKDLIEKVRKENEAEATRLESFNKGEISEQEFYKNKSKIMASDTM
jgi:hypothetical protein